MSLTMPKQLVLDRAAIKAVAPPIAEIVEIVEETYRMDAAGKVEAPTKIGVHPYHSHSFLHAMPAWVSGGGALSPRGDWRSPSDAVADIWLVELRESVPGRDG